MAERPVDRNYAFPSMMILTRWTGAAVAACLFVKIAVTGLAGFALAIATLLAVIGYGVSRVHDLSDSDACQARMKRDQKRRADRARRASGEVL